MKLNLKTTFFLTFSYEFLILNSFFYQNVAQDIKPEEKLGNNTCSTEDLNHSVLIECKNSQCEDGSRKVPIWPVDSNQVIHMRSSRDGDRFVVTQLENLNLRETDMDRLWDINSTLYVKSDALRQTIYGFGTSLDTKKFVAEKQNGVLDQNFLPIAKDLFTNLPSGINFSLLRVPITKNAIINNYTSHMLKSLDEVISKVLVDEQLRKIRLILTFDDIEGSLDMIESLKVISATLRTLNVLECWAVAVEQDWLAKSISNEGMLGYIQELFSTKNIFGLTSTKEAPSFIDHISKTQSVLKGLLINTEYSTGYNILDYVRSYSEFFSIVSISGSGLESQNYGDWDNAKNYAVEILKQMEHGSNSYIEDSSSLDLLENSRTFRDKSIYSALSSHNVHLRGPMYYAIGHFSRHVIPGSRRLEARVETSPNMFAAHYSAFRTPDNHVVSVVLNDNEHLLPFRVVVDGTIVSQINIKPKSLNTIVIKL